MTTATEQRDATAVDSPSDGSERPLLPTGPYVAPRVNLLPPEVAARKALQKLQAGLAAGVVLCGALVGAVYVHADSGRASAQSTLDQAKTENSTLQAAKTRLAPVQDARNAVDSARQALVAAMGSEVLWSRDFDQVRLLLPTGVRLSSFSVSPAAVAATGTAAASATPTTGVATPAAGGASSAPIATVSISGMAVDHDAVAAWLDAMVKIPGWSDAYLTSTSVDDKGVVNFTVTADISSAALSHRYTEGS